MSNNGSNKRKAVRFAQEQAQSSRKKEKRSTFHDSVDIDDDDDVDAWEGDDDPNSDIPSMGTVIDAKRQRRLKRVAKDDDDDDEGSGDKHDTDNGNNIDSNKVSSRRLDQERSLAAEGIEVEPFNMDKEQTDGSGYFDGDTYIFRKRNDEEEGEPDAWLDSLSEKDIVTTSSSTSYRKRQDNVDKQQQQQQQVDDENRPSMDDLSEQELYSKIVLLVSDSETVMQAIIRYGNLLKRRRQDKQQQQQQKDNHPEEATASQQLAKQSLNDLTEAANALLLQGKVDIYQKTRKELLNLLPNEALQSNAAAATTTTTNHHNNSNNKVEAIQWEYEGSQDGQIHGPYSTAEMLGWIRAGYFVGPGAAVRVRTVEKKQTNQQQQQQDELLADLLEDEDNDDDDDAKHSGVEIIRGEWMQSDAVDFTQYC